MLIKPGNCYDCGVSIVETCPTCNSMRPAENYTTGFLFSMDKKAFNLSLCKDCEARIRPEIVLNNLQEGGECLDFDPKGQYVYESRDEHFKRVGKI